MQPSIARTANQAYKKYKEAGGTWTFTEFVTRQKQKAFSADGEADHLFMVNPSVNDTVQSAIDNMLKEGGLESEESGKTVFGVKKGWVIGVGVLLAAGIVFIVYKKMK